MNGNRLPIDFAIPFVVAGLFVVITDFLGNQLMDSIDLSMDVMEQLIMFVKFQVGIISFVVTRYILIASGVFQPLIPLRFLKKWKQFITYYNVIYYDENIKQILTYRKQGKMEEAAREFAILTNTGMEEAREAMKIWDSIYGEGILQIAKD